MPLIHLWEDVSTFRPEIIARAADLKESAFLVEKDGSGVKGLMKIRGIFQRYDCVNANGRKYEKSLWERVLKDDRILETINTGGMHGLTEHPEDGRTRLDRGVTIIVTKIWDDNKGNIMGEAVIPATRAGQDIAAIVDAGGSIGVSSRADGEVEMVSEGYQRVKPETFTLITWDVVFDNSVPGARPSSVRESAAPVKEAPAPLVVESIATHQEPKITTIMSKIGEMRKLDLAVSGLQRSSYKKLGLNERSAIYESVIELQSTARKLMAEDAALANYGNKVLQKAKLIEDEVEAAPVDAPPPAAPGGGGEGGGEGDPVIPEVDQEAFVKVVTKVLKDLCPECDDLKIGEQASAMFNKFAEGEPLGIQATCDALREGAAGGGPGEGGEGAAPAAGAPPPPPPDDLQIESALSIMRVMTENNVPKAQLEEAQKLLKTLEGKLAEFDKTKDRLAKNLQLLKESAEYIELSDAKLAENQAILEAAVALLKEHKIDDASILSMIEKKGNIENLKKFTKKGADGKDDAEGEGKDKDGKDKDKDKDKDKTDESKTAEAAKLAEAEKAKTAEAAKLAEAEKVKTDAAAKLVETEAKAKAEFGKYNDGKKTVKEIEEAMNAMFTDVDWKKMVNFTEASKEIEKKLTETAEPHDFVRQMGRLREGAFRQLNHIPKK